MCHTLQDVIQFKPLLRTMAAQVVHDPLFVPQLMAHVGPAALADWMVHVGGLAAFSTLNTAGTFATYIWQLCYL
jgi:hypothetical protein